MKISHFLKIIYETGDKILDEYSGPYYGEPSGAEALMDFLEIIENSLTKDMICSKCSRIIEGDCVECSDRVVIKVNNQDKIMCMYCYLNTKKTCDCKEESN